MTELPWMAEARRHVGLKEIVGAKHNPIIQSWLKEMGNFPNAAKAWYADDETPWCGLFVGYCLGKSGRGVIKDWYRAKAWAEAGLTKLAKPDLWLYRREIPQRWRPCVFRRWQKR